MHKIWQKNKAYINAFWIILLFNCQTPEIQKEYGSFSKYLWAYTNDKIIYEKKENETTSTLSDQISKDLKKKGMSFVGSITIYSYLEAIGIYNHHDRNCFLHL